MFQKDILKGKRILVTGGGTGLGKEMASEYAELGAEVYTIERQHELFKKTSLFLPKLGYNPKKFIFGDGYKGLKEKAPFDKIIVTAGAPFVPKPLLAQLKVGGMLLIPVGDKKQIMTLFHRKSPKEFDKQELGDFAFVPMLQKKA
jgi:protein-L-isoaspartate(D-aspartate) O-methyltransferase